MIHMQFNTQSDCRAGATGAALEIVPLEYVPAQAKGWIAPCLVRATKRDIGVALCKF
jgi:hypothetical protein